MRRYVSHTVFVFALVLFTGLLAACNGARDDALNAVDTTGAKGFMIKTISRGDHTRKYGLFVPLAYDPAKAYPVIIFLHGMGEGGSDAHANMRVGLAPFVHDREETFPFICIFPQSANGGWDENSDAAGDVIAELDAVSKDYHVDQDRVSLTGLSTGGYGTWAIGAKYKDRFCALVPMGTSSGDEKDAEALVHMPIWAFHNSGDMFAGVWNDTSMVARINALGGHAKINTYGALGHDVWETVYADGALFTWLLEQRRGTAPTAAGATTPPAAPHASSAAPINEPGRALSSSEKVILTPY